MLLWLSYPQPIRSVRGYQEDFKSTWDCGCHGPALYAKACEVTWKHKDLYAEDLLRLGTFHTIFNHLSIIGKRFEDAGLHDICTENQGYSQKVQSQTSSKEMYNHAHRVHKCIYQALLQEGNWLLHPYTVHHMIPWFFAYDKFNYAR